MQSEGGDLDEFERATDAEPSEESYYYEEAQERPLDSDGSEEGFYMPTLIHKAKPAAAKKKKKRQTKATTKKSGATKAKPQQVPRSPDSARGQAATAVQAPLILGGDKKQSQTLSGDGSRDMVLGGQQAASSVHQPQAANNSNQAANLLN
jgi:hypothetical protein